MDENLPHQLLHSNLWFELHKQSEGSLDNLDEYVDIYFERPLADGSSTDRIESIRCKLPHSQSSFWCMETYFSQDPKLWLKVSRCVPNGKNKCKSDAEIDKFITDLEVKIWTNQ